MDGPQGGTLRPSTKHQVEPCVHVWSMLSNKHQVEPFVHLPNIRWNPSSIYQASGGTLRPSTKHQVEPCFLRYYQTTSFSGLEIEMAEQFIPSAQLTPST